MQSLSEVDTTSKRASRAAGFSWGISEEIGKAIRSLELFGLPGVVNLNLYLKKVKKKHPKKIYKIDTSAASGGRDWSGRDWSGRDWIGRC